MDGIFGQQNFRNEIIWKRTPFSGSSKARARQLPRNHDVILFYSASGERKWNAPSLPYTEKYLKRFKWEDDRGMYRKTLLKTYSQETFERLKTEDRLICPQREGAKYSYKQYLHESNGQRQIDDVWTDINMLNPVAKERRGYPTQKPLALLERIISASSDKGDVILDPFCGCGTSIDAAEKTGRRWIGIDITRLATAIIKQRLAENFGFQVFKKIRVIGEPVNIDEAVALAKEDKFGFQYWVVGKLGAPPIEHRRGADRGIDGRIYFYDGYGPAKEIIISVKAGEHINPAFVRELRGVIERERAEMGILVCVESPTKEMLLEAKRGGSYVGVAGTFPRLQIMTLADIFANKPLNIPGRINPYEKKRPASIASPEPEQLRLLP